MARLTTGDLTDMYDEMLNDCYPAVMAAGMEFGIADTLKTMDLIAYRCGLNDFVDCLLQDEHIYEHMDGEYYDEPEEGEDDEEDSNNEDK